MATMCLTRGWISRRDLLLSLPGLAVARRILAQAAPEPLGIVGLHSVTLAVSDVERSVDFYQSLFGMPIQARQGDDVLLRVGDGPLYLALTPAGDPPPRFARWGMAVADFDPRRVVDALRRHGLRRVQEDVGLADGSRRVRSSTRDGTPEIYMEDLNGLVIQLQDPAYCGGSGLLGGTCDDVELAPVPGDLALEGLSHLTIHTPDPEAANAFYRRVFGMDIQAHQAASPLLGAGAGDHFLMFIGGGDPGSGGARVNHVCFTTEGFEVEGIQAVLEDHGIRPRDEAGAGPLRHWVSMRMPNRGGAPGGTPELYFSDPDGLSIQLQDVVYCGGGGYLGGECS